MKVRQQESHLQQCCVAWFRHAWPRYASLLFAVPNGGKRSYKTAALMKAEGALAGVADVLLLVPNDEYHGLAIEFKYGKGRQSPAQKKWQAAVENVGYRYEVVRDYADFIELINKYLQ